MDNRGDGERGMFLYLSSDDSYEEMPPAMSTPPRVNRELQARREIATRIAQRVIGYADSIQSQKLLELEAEVENTLRRWVQK